MNKFSLKFFKKNIHILQQKIAFKFSHISVWGKLCLFWVFITFVSLFTRWGGAFWNIVEAQNIENFSFTSFSSTMGYIWYFILLWLIIIIFSVCSIKKKQKLKYFSLIEVRDYSSAIITSIVIFFTAIHCYFITQWLQLFSSNITHSNGIILCMTWAIIIFIWGIVIRSEYRMNIKWSYINDTSRSPKEFDYKETKDNMKLPF